MEPVFTYGRDQGCSVTGGVVYRGDDLASLRGSYLYADLCSSGVRALRPDGDGGFEPIQITDGPEQIIGFAQDRDGEVYVLSLSAGVAKLSTG